MSVSPAPWGMSSSTGGVSWAVFDAMGDRVGTALGIAEAETLVRLSAAIGPHTSAIESHPLPWHSAEQVESPYSHSRSVAIVDSAGYLVATVCGWDSDDESMLRMRDNAEAILTWAN